MLLEAAPWGDPSEAILRARISAAASLRTLAVIPARYLRAVSAEAAPVRRAFIRGEEALNQTDALAQCRLIEIADGPACLETGGEIAENQPGLAHRRAFAAPARRRDTHAGTARRRRKHHPSLRGLPGPGDEAERPRFVKEVLREIHGQLVKHGVRNEVTLIASGGIALAEHMAKAIICGADLVGVDIPLLISLGCRVCSGSHTSGCPARIHEAAVPYAAQRMVNLMGAWHNQLIEVLGAMGIREVRRLRGEVGRAMFIEDLERDAFKDLVRSVWF